MLSDCRPPTAVAAIVRLTAAARLRSTVLSMQGVRWRSLACKDAILGDTQTKNDAWQKAAQARRAGRQPRWSYCADQPPPELLAQDAVLTGRSQRRPAGLPSRVSVCRTDLLEVGRNAANAFLQTTHPNSLFAGLSRPIMGEKFTWDAV